MKVFSESLRAFLFSSNRIEPALDPYDPGRALRALCHLEALPWLWQPCPPLQMCPPRRRGCQRQSDQSRAICLLSICPCLATFFLEELGQRPPPPSHEQGGTLKTDGAAASLRWLIFPQGFKNPDRANWESGLNKRERVPHLEKSEPVAPGTVQTGHWQKVTPLVWLHCGSLPKLAGEIHHRSGWPVANLHIIGAPESGMECLFGRHTLGHRDDESGADFPRAMEWLHWWHACMSGLPWPFPTHSRTSAWVL